MNPILFFVVLMLVAAGCESSPTPPVKTDGTDAAKAEAPDMIQAAKTKAGAKSFEPVTDKHYVFVGTPNPTQPLDCNFWEGPDSPRSRPQPPPGDETTYGNSISIELLEVVQNPGGVGLDMAPEEYRRDSPPRAQLLFSMGEEGNVGTWPSTRTYCEHLKALLAADFAVFVAYEVDVDWRNSEKTPWKETWYSLGSGPGNPNKVFATLDEAKSYAESLVAAAH